MNRQRVAFFIVVLGSNLFVLSCCAHKSKIDVKPEQFVKNSNLSTEKNSTPTQLNAEYTVPPSAPTTEVEVKVNQIATENLPASEVLVESKISLPSAPDFQSQMAKLIGTYQYRILIEEKLAGKQIVKISQKSPETILMEVDIEMKVGFLLFFSYEHNHSTQEEWKAGKLASLEGQTDDNGTKFNLSLKFDGKQMSGEGQNGKLTVKQPMVTNNAWNIAFFPQHFPVLDVMNPETGEVTSFEVIELPDETIYTSLKDYKCKKIKFEGKEWTFWFDSSGLLVKQQDNLLGYKVEIILEKVLDSSK